MKEESKELEFKVPTKEEIGEALLRAEDDIKNGRYRYAEEVF